jgi:hypothetical protein
MGERTDALHIFTNNSGNYNKLSNGEPIGESIISDLRQYFITLFKNDYRYNYYNWEKLEINSSNILPNDECYYNLDNDNDFKIKSKIRKYISVEGKKDDRIEIPEDLLNSISNVNYIRDDSYTKGKYPYLKVDNAFYIPDITVNDNYSEKALLTVDLIKLNELFKSHNYKNIDDIFLLDFYKEFKYKIDTLKNKIITDDEDIKNTIREDIINKLKIIYKIDKKSGPGQKKDTLDKLIDNIIQERAKNLANLNLIKDYSKKIGGGKTVSIKDLDDKLLNMYQSINNIKRSDIQLNDFDIEILSAIKYSINKDSGIEDYTFNISTKDKNNNSQGLIQDDSCNNMAIITRIIKDNSIKKYKKYLALIYFFSNNRKKNKDIKKGGIGQPILNPDNVQEPIKKNEEIPVYTEKSEKKINIAREKAEPKDVSFQTNKILADLKDIYIDLVKIYIFIAEPNKEVKKYGDALIEEIIKSEYDDKVEDLDSLKQNIKKGIDKKALEEKQKKEEIDQEISKKRDAEKGNDKTRVPINNQDKYKANSNISNLKSYQENLSKKKEELLKLLKNLDNKLNELKNIPYATEYIEHINNIKNYFKLEYVKEKTNSNNCKIIKEFEEFYNELVTLYTKNKQLYDINDKVSTNSAEASVTNNINEQYKATNREIEKNIGGKILKELEKLIGENGDFINIIELLKESNYDENAIDDSKFVKNKNGIGDGEELLYETLWQDYNKGISINNKLSNKANQYFTYLNEGEKLKNSIVLNDLDPEIVLKITVQDKAVFLLLIFIIRTICIVIIELLIEYNMLKSLQSSIVAYTLLYLTILLLFIIFINLDSYKLRIIFNYLNMHANTSNIIIHIVLFSIFAFLVIIIIQTDNFINNVIDIFDYTYIYNYLFDFSFGKTFNSEFENNISPDEKIKLLYRLDIVSMIIFIFTGILVILI